MIAVGVDTHKERHYAVALDHLGQMLAELTFAATGAGYAELQLWAEKLGDVRELVFVHDDGELDATLLHGDVDWEPRRVADASGLPDFGDLILGEEERAFVMACWIATASRREHARSGRRAA